MTFYLDIWHAGSSCPVRRSSVPDAWLFCVAVNLVICVSLSLLHIFVVLSPGFDFVFSMLVKRLAGKSISKMTYIVEWDVKL